MHLNINSVIKVDKRLSKERTPNKYMNTMGHLWRPNLEKFICISCLDIFQYSIKANDKIFIYIFASA